MEWDSCDHCITEKEILNSLKQLHNSKTLGTDGLPPNFYNVFWIDIKLLLIESIEHATKTGELCIEQKRGIITLLPKKHKSRHFLKNWRPISLLNTDYKIKAKLKANRLKNVLPVLINNDQTCYLKNIYIGENIRLLQDISFFTEYTKTSAILFSVDFEKAFDSLNWNFSFKVLKHVNSGENLIGYIQMMYNNIESTVLNNGNTGDFLI